MALKSLFTAVKYNRELLEESRHPLSKRISRRNPLSNRIYTEIDFDPLSGESQHILGEHVMPFSKGTDPSAVRDPFRKKICRDFSKGTHLNAV